MLTNSIIANEMYEKGGDQIFIIYQNMAVWLENVKKALKNY